MLLDPPFFYNAREMCRMIDNLCQPKDPKQIIIEISCVLKKYPKY